jgi:hypothetical protein
MAGLNANAKQSVSPHLSAPSFHLHLKTKKIEVVTTVVPILLVA